LIVGVDVELIEMREQCVTVGMNRHPTGGNVFVDRALAPLSFLGPKPALICRDRQSRPQFQHTVVTLSDLDLCAGFIEMQATPHLGR
jgi:hypothetical protein